MRVYIFCISISMATNKTSSQFEKSQITWPSKIEDFLTSEPCSYKKGLVEDVSLILLNDIKLLLKFINYAGVKHLYYLLNYSRVESFSKLANKILYSPSFYIRKDVLEKMVKFKYSNSDYINYKISLINRKRRFSEQILSRESIGTIYKKYSDYRIIEHCISVCANQYAEEGDLMYFECDKYIKPFKIIIRYLSTSEIIDTLMSNGEINVNNWKQLIIVSQTNNRKFYVVISDKDANYIQAIYAWPDKYYLSVNLIFYLQLLARKRKDKNIIMFSGDFIENFIKKILSGFTNCNMQKLILYFV